MNGNPVASRRGLCAPVQEAQKYVDDRTPGFAVAAIPDSAYRISGSALPIAYHRDRVVVLPYSLVIPYILMIYNNHERTDIDLAAQQTGRALDELLGSLQQLGEAHTRMTADIQTLDRHEKEMRRALTTATDALALVLNAAKERVHV